MTRAESGRKPCQDHTRNQTGLSREETAACGRPFQLQEWCCTFTPRDVSSCRGDSRACPRQPHRDAEMKRAPTGGEDVMTDTAAARRYRANFQDEIDSA